MKHSILKKSVLVAALLGALSTTPAFAAQSGEHKRWHQQQHSAQHMRGKRGGIEGMAMRNLAVQSLSELSGQSPDEIRRQLQDQHPRELLHKLGIDKEIFRKAMKSNRLTLIQQAQDMGWISSEQASLLRDRMDKREKKAVSQR